MNALTAFALFLLIVVLAFAVTRLRPARSQKDVAITTAVNAALRAEFPLGNAQVDVKTFDGVVILGGFVREREQAAKAVSLASAVAGVKSVDNRISVRAGH